MDTNEAKDLSREITKAIMEHKAINDTLYKIARVLSYLISEQEERDALIKLMAQLREELEGNAHSVGLIHQMRLIKEQTDSNRKWLMGILSALIVGIVLRGFELLHFLK